MTETGAGGYLLTLAAPNGGKILNVGGTVTLGAINSNSNNLTSTFSNNVTTATTFTNSLGNVTLGGANSFVGGLILTGGTTNFSAANNLGSGTQVVNFNGGTLNATATTDFGTHSTTISAGKTATLNVATAGTTLTLNNGIATTTGGLTKTGLGNLAITSNNLYTGVTTVSGGALLANNSTLSATGAGAVNVAATADNTTATLGGTGTVSGAVTMAAPTGTGRINRITGGTVGTVGTLTLSSTLTFGSGSTYYVDIGAGAANNDRLNITNGATVGSGTNVQFNQLGTLDQGKYVLAKAASGLGSGFTSGTTPTAYRLAQSATELDLISQAGIGTVTAAPAAGTILTGTSTTISGTVQNTAFSGGDNLNFAVNGGSTFTANAGSTGAYSGVNYTGVSAGNNTVALNVTGTNAATGTAVTSGSGSTTVRVLDAANASFAASPDTNSLFVNIGSFSQGAGGGTETSGFNIYNLLQTAGFTADLQLASFSLTTPDDANLNTNLSTFTNLSAGQFNAYLASLSTATVGTFSESYNLVFNSRDGANAFADTQTLSLTLSGTVTAVPEPAMLGTIAIAGVGLLRRRRR